DGLSSQYALRQVDVGSSFAWTLAHLGSSSIAGSTCAWRTTNPSRSSRTRAGAWAAPAPPTTGHRSSTPHERCDGRPRTCLESLDEAALNTKAPNAGTLNALVGK